MSGRGRRARASVAGGLAMLAEDGSGLRLGDFTEPFGGASVVVVDDRGRHAIEEDTAP